MEDNSPSVPAPSERDKLTGHIERLDRIIDLFLTGCEGGGDITCETIADFVDMRGKLLRQRDE